jgi:multiple sugar transport system ATP-binding protein
LDAQLRDDTRTELKQLHQTLGITTIYVTHDQVEAMTLADKIVVLNRGRIQQIGEPENIYNLPANQMVATFLGNPPMNILSAIYQGDHFDIAGQLFTISEDLQAKLGLSLGQNVNLGIRPEHLYIHQQSESEKSPEPGSGITVEVKVVEPLGKETLVRTSLPGLSNFINIQVSGYLRLHPGNQLFLQLDLYHLFLFDPHTGDRIFPAK